MAEDRDTLPLPEQKIQAIFWDEAGVRREIRAWTPEEMLAHREEYAAARVAQAVAQERAYLDREWRQRMDVEASRLRAMEQRYMALLQSVASKEALLPRTVVLQAGSPSPQLPAIPAGWRLVPEEATAEMLEASHHWLSSFDMRLCWRYVLHAAPQPPSAWRPNQTEDQQ
jgi:hypothetical protein